MTEQEWSKEWTFRALYDIVRNNATLRKSRLFMAACCRLEEKYFFDRRIVDAVLTAERCADDVAIESTVCMLNDQISTAASVTRGRSKEFETDLGRIVEGIWHLVRDMPPPPDIDDSESYRCPEDAVAHAAYLSLREYPQKLFTGGSGDALEYCGNAIQKAQSVGVSLNSHDFNAKMRMSGMPIARILRDIFGNPFRPVAIDPRWRTSDSVGVACGIYEDRAFERMPILADALMDAGCADEQVLGHCRGEGPHVRGCWVVDLILGKE